MKTSETPALYACSRCKRMLPAEAYYVNKKTGTPTRYCKECQKAATRDSRLGRKHLLIRTDRPDYPVITAIEDPVVRMALLMEALKKVAESIRRKRERERQAEWEAE